MRQNHLFSLNISSGNLPCFSSIINDKKIIMTLMF